MKNMSREDVIKLISEVRNIVERELDLTKYLGKELLTNDTGETDVEYEFLGVSNGFLSEIVYAVTGYDVDVYGEVEKLYPCPCCGFRTLTEIYNPEEGTGYDICAYCKWEDDGTTDADAYRSVNRGSINDYRSNIQANPDKYYIKKWLD